MSDSDINWGELINKQEEEQLSASVKIIVNVLDKFYTNLLDKSFNKEQAFRLTIVALNTLLKGKKKGDNNSG